MFKLTGWLVEDVDSGASNRAILVINNSILNIIINPDTLKDFTGYKVRVDAGVYKKELVINTVFVSDRNEDRRCPLSGKVVSITKDSYIIRLNKEYGGGCIPCRMYNESKKLRLGDNVSLKGFLYQNKNELYFVIKEKI